VDTSNFQTFGGSLGPKKLQLNTAQSQFNTRLTQLLTGKAAGITLTVPISKLVDSIIRNIAPLILEEDTITIEGRLDCANPRSYVGEHGFCESEVTEVFVRDLSFEGIVTPQPKI